MHQTAQDSASGRGDRASRSQGGPGGRRAPGALVAIARAAGCAKMLAKSEPRRPRAAWAVLLVPLLAAASSDCTPKTNPVVAGPTGSSSATAARSPLDDDGGGGEDDHEEPDDGLRLGQEDPDRPSKPPPRVGLSGGLAALEASEYATAETELRKAAQGADKGVALAGLARVMLETGRLDEAVKLADEASAADKAGKIAAAPVKARALMRRGKLDDALKACDAVKNEDEARRARLVCGEIMLRMGRSRDAEPYLMTLINDFNSRKITTRDAEGMALVGRASHLLRS